MAKQIPAVEPSCQAPFDFTSGRSLCHICTELKGPYLQLCSRVISDSPSMQALMEKSRPIARTDASVIILGESGSGKEVLARAIHVNSTRVGQPFVAVNVAALPPALLETELFGHAKGAFTGAHSHRTGLFETANDGTMFLDEIGEMPLSLQAKLLRVLQDGEIRRVGESGSFAIDVRIICATHRDLYSRVKEGQFREDLYYRLKVFSLRVAPLRERVGDILPLARVFLGDEKHATCRMTPEAERALESHSWPGNVRELANAVKHGAVLSEGADVALHHLPEDLIEPRNERPIQPLRSLAEVERQHILEVLEACGGHQVEAARVLEIGRTTLWRKLRSLGIDG